MIPRSRKQIRVRPRLEALEGRQLLAGDVRLSLKPRTLQIRGGNGPDSVSITATSTEITVQGINGSTVNGQASVTVPLRDNVVISTFGGPDEVRIDGLKLEGRIRIRTGQADDLVTFANTSVKGTTFLDGAGGSNHLATNATNRFTTEPIFLNIKSVAESVPSLPTSLLVARGRFDNSAQGSTVVFANDSGYRVEIPQILVDQETVNVGVPALLDPATFNNPAGLVSVSVRQLSKKDKLEGSTVLANLPVAALPTTGLAAGTLTLQTLTGIDTILQAAILDYQSVQTVAETRIDTAPLIAQIQTLSDQIKALQTQISTVTQGSASSISLGRLNGKPVAIDSDALALADRLLLAQGISVTGTPETDPSQVIGVEVNQIVDESDPGDVRDSLIRLRSAGSIAVGVGGLAAESLANGAFDVATSQKGGSTTAGYQLASVLLSGLTVAQTLHGANSQLIAGESTPENYDKNILNIRTGGVDALNTSAFRLLGSLQEPTPATGGLQQVVSSAQTAFELAFRDDRPTRISVTTQILNNFTFINTAFGGSGGGGGGGLINATNLSGIYQFTGVGAFAGTSNGNMTLTITAQNGQNITGRANFTNLGGQTLSGIFTAIFNPNAAQNNFVGTVDGLLNGTDLNFAGTIVGRSISDGVLFAPASSGTFTLGLQ